ncbi:MAG: hypothetical protein U1E15_05980 [Hyphomicrobiales bacterium]
MRTLNTLKQMWIGLRQGLGLTLAERRDLTATALSLGDTTIRR